MFPKKIVSKIICSMLCVTLFQNISFAADSIKVEVDTIGGNRKELSLFLTGKQKKEYIFSTQFDDNLDSATQKSIFSVINGKSVIDEAAVKGIIDLVTKFLLVNKKLDILLFYPDECSDEEIKLFNNKDNIGSLSEEKDFLFKKLIELIEKNAI